MLQSEQNLEPERKCEEADNKELQLKVELAKTELETKKLEPEIMKMLHEENSRVREHEVTMTKLKTDEMKAQFEIDKQRFEERKLVMEESQQKLNEINEEMKAIRTELQQSKQNGTVALRSIGLVISAVAIPICNYFGLFGTGAISRVAASVAAVPPMTDAIVNRGVRLKDVSL